MQCPSCQAASALDATFCRSCGAALPRSTDAQPAGSSGVAWKWVAIGVGVMFGTNVGAGFALGLIMGAAGVHGIGPLGFAAIGLVCFGVGGFIVGKWSPGKTILEPGLSAALAVAITLAMQGAFDLGTVLVGGVLPFGAGVLGGYLGEKSQGTV